MRINASLSSSGLSPRHAREPRAATKGARRSVEHDISCLVAFVDGERQDATDPGREGETLPLALPGRPDIFPTRFVSKRTGKPGYAPECSNKFQAGLCILKTGGRCGGCPNQAFSPLSDHAMLDHLQGRRVMGVYPLLEDETCWFLAADFDKRSWKLSS